MRHYYKKAFVYWIPCAIILTMIAGLVYTAVQQDMRQTANDPQIQISEDIANVLTQGQPAQAILPQNGQTDLSKTLSTYVAIFDDTGKAIAYSAQLNGGAPSLPPGVFDYARTHTQDRFTWQPTPGVREAAVVTHYSGNGQAGFVMAGRSLREVEIREDQLMLQAIAAWILMLAVSLASFLFFIHPRSSVFIAGILVEKQIIEDSDTEEDSEEDNED